MDDRTDITRLLLAYGKGDHVALDTLMPVVYEQLRGIARSRLRSEREGHTLNTTGLVHEVYLKLIDLNRVDWHDRKHFFAFASKLMRQILVDYARSRKAEKRGGGITVQQLNEELFIHENQVEKILELDMALNQLSVEYPRVAEAISHHYFAGLTDVETAQVLEVSVPTVERDLRFGRAWLTVFFKKEKGQAPGP